MIVTISPAAALLGRTGSGKEAHKHSGDLSATLMVVFKSANLTLNFRSRISMKGSDVDKYGDLCD